jgi:O-antigen/teichoic acid export membrane protein
VLVVGVEVLFGDLLISFLFGVEDPQALSLLIVLCIGSIFMNARQILADILRGLGRPSVPTLAELVSLALVSLFAIRLWERGVTGVAWAVTLAAALSFAYIMVVGFAPWPKRRSAVREVQITGFEG